ncbi:hypothetical protein [Candidatus Nitrospira allomarina]|uniref:Secreted protein n=1 Tax=Candidatus Nitrospira allomarina TaxID=3020900 RepID=A0AA96GAA3_9BACT|nr:hypothetical protein [Candidatus Nitrospira allomarina]WNM58359.1 hypothetical protein PP769_00945 [Candidatus Nitrospira allomarina]
MKAFTSICFLFVSLSAEASTFDLVVAGKRCSEGQSKQLECNYGVGHDLWVTISGIGQKDGAVTFMKSDENGDYYAAFGLMHECVIVKPGKKTEEFLDFAFISPRTGKVFSAWQECQGE